MGSHGLLYIMTKHAVIGLVRALPGPLSREGIRLSAVCPGLVDTPLTAVGRDRLRAAGTPMLTADEVAAAVEQLLHTGCDAIRGECWPWSQQTLPGVRRLARQMRPLV
ncbi:SDR family oxidoreductase [Streptomyces sp. NEAU-S77]|uniref:SDR family oxidoreductase n=1 Tax=Streptomyces sp. NEAU-S77 TaxID=3411033 RepID=UPI003B9EDA9E